MHIIRFLQLFGFTVGMVGFLLLLLGWFWSNQVVGSGTGLILAVVGMLLEGGGFLGYLGGLFAECLYRRGR